VAFGVGFDTSRYGHHVTFLRADLQPACLPFEFPESRAGYDQVLRKFQDLQAADPAVHFHIRLDAAGQYATNLSTATTIRGSRRPPPTPPRPTKKPQATIRTKVPKDQWSPR